MSKWSHSSISGRAVTLLGALLAGVGLIGFGVSTAGASTHTVTPSRAAWRHDMQHLGLPGVGCFTGSYPNLQWKLVQCHEGPNMPLGPGGVRHVVTRNVGRSVAGGARMTAEPTQETVGNGYDFSAEASSGTISTATGSFPSVSSGITETGKYGNAGSPTANTYTLQLNTQFFSGSPACANAAVPANCQGWQQFIYATPYPTNPEVFMQYWLLNYLSPGDPSVTCPANWNTNGEDCWENSLLVQAPAVAVSALGSVTLTGNAAGSGGNDSVVFYDGTGNVTAVGAGSVLGLAGNWNIAEFGVFGDGNSSAATFGSNNGSPPATLDVKTSINDGATQAPICYGPGPSLTNYYGGFTAETNNLGFATAPTLTAGSEPAIETQQTIGGSANGCATAAEGSNTVTVTNPGNQTSPVDTATSLQMKATDSASGQTLTWSATGLPAGLSISPTSGLISGKPTTVGSGSVTVTAKDTTGASGSASFTWKVTNNVSVTNPGNQRSYEGLPDIIIMKATDSAPGQRLTWSATGLPPGVSINSSLGVIYGKPSKVGTYSVTVKATDRTGASGTTTFTWTVKFL